MYETKQQLSNIQIKDKLLEKLVDSGWYSFLRGFLISKDFQDIVDFLVKETQEKRLFTPALKQIFRAFTECPIDQVKVIIMGQDVYPQPLTADGIAFSCSNTKKPEASLRYILRAVQTTVPTDIQAIIDEDHKVDLVRWSHQGVLMLNAALSTEVNKIGKHITIWKPFIEYVLDMLNTNKQELIFVFMGKEAQKYQELIGGSHTILECTHPAYAAYMKRHHWDCNDIFNKVNQQLTEYHKEIINW